MSYMELAASGTGNPGLALLIHLLKKTMNELISRVESSLRATSCFEYKGEFEGDLFTSVGLPAMKADRRKLGKRQAICTILTKTKQQISIRR